MVSHIPLSIITIPPEICRLVLKSLSSRDITTLRLVSRDYYNYFTSEDLCHFAQKLYFPLSSEAGKPERSRKDFDATYLRSQRWKQGRPSHVEIIDKVAFGSTSLSNGFLVDSEAGLLAYQRYSDLSPIFLLVLEPLLTSLPSKNSRCYCSQGLGLHRRRHRWPRYFYRPGSRAG